MLFAVGVPLTVGAEGADWSPFATALAVIVPVGVIFAVAPVTFAIGILVGKVIVAVLAFAAVGVPVIETVTTVLLVLTAVPGVNPAGRPETAKSVAMIEVAYVALESVYTILPLTDCPTLRPVSPVDVTAIAGTASVVIVALAELAGEALRFVVSAKRA